MNDRKVILFLAVANLIVGIINMMLGWFFDLPLNFILGCFMLLASIVGVSGQRIEKLLILNIQQNDLVLDCLSRLGVQKLIDRRYKKNDQR